MTVAIRESNYPGYDWGSPNHFPSVAAIKALWQDNSFGTFKADVGYYVDELVGPTFTTPITTFFGDTTDVFGDVSARSLAQSIGGQIAEKFNVSPIWDAIERVRTARDAVTEFLKAPLDFLTEEIRNFDIHGSGADVDLIDQKIDLIYEKKTILLDALKDLFPSGSPPPATQVASAPALNAHGVQKIAAGFSNVTFVARVKYEDVYIVTGIDQYVVDHRLTGVEISYRLNGAPAATDPESSYFIVDGAKSSSINGGRFFDILALGAGADIGRGAGGKDYLSGGSGNDRLYGGADDDRLYGGSGIDLLSGGDGADRFDFRTIGSSGVGPGRRDVIADFASGDRIDLARIDANPGNPGNQAFRLDTNGVFTKGEIRLAKSGADIIVSLNVDADAAAEMQILVKGVSSLQGSDFVL